MKILSLVLIGCILFLCSFEGIAKPVMPTTKDCCKKMAMACHKKPAKEKGNPGGCTEPGCAMMFSCSICGFIVEAETVVSPPYAANIQKPVATYITAKPVAYHADNWKPPQVC